MAEGINNAGYVVGRSDVFFDHRHAVMWIPIPDTDPREYNIVDLTPPDELPSGSASFVTEPVGGTMQVVGDQSGTTVWTVDVATRTVLTTKQAPEGGRVRDIYAGAEVEEVLFATSVWNVVDNVVHELPLSGSGCSASARAFDSSGNIYGKADFSTAKKTACNYARGAVISRPVVWTKIVTVPEESE
jgi:hypothetical protein